METLTYQYSAHDPAGAGPSPAPVAAPVLVGVVGSGNLEIMIEPVDLAGGCAVEIITAAVGFGAIWQAVITDFFERWRPSNLRVSINDVGATPAVVSLRLDQAMAAVRGETA